MLSGYPLPCHTSKVLKLCRQVVDGSGRLLLNPHCYEKQCLVGGSTHKAPTFYQVCLILHQNHIQWTTSQLLQSAGIKTLIHLPLK